MQSKIGEYLDTLFTSERLGSQMVFQKTLPAQPAEWAEPRQPWPQAVRFALESAGINNLYRHQAEAMDFIRRGQHVIVDTPTASGKTLVYDLPVLEHFIADPEATALFIFPLKALAQNQLQTFEALSAGLKTARPEAAIYDGDTSAYRRKRIREAPPNVIITNPEMLHLSILAHHRRWSPFLARLHMVVVDEVHTYRGVMGAHVAQIFRRFHRICRHYGVSPTFVFSSATVANPAQLAYQLTGLKVETIDKSGAPRGRRHLVFLNPMLKPARTAILLLKAALEKSLRSIVYTQSRKLTELIAMWVVNESGVYADRISAYRAGLLPQERREVEARLSSGDLLAVITTSALELGIDIGDLDLCLLVGYPGSIISTWQRGGRVGRSGQESAVILIAGEDAIDQYFMRNPLDFIEREPEAAVVNPHNQQILARHLVCAAAELTLATDECLLDEENAREALAKLEAEGQLLKSADGRAIYSRRKAPHRDIDLRGAGQRFQIIEARSDKLIGEIDDYRAYRETHPGAVYLHKGETFVVDHIDIPKHTIVAVRSGVDYFTRVRGYKQVEILKVKNELYISDTVVCEGIIKVTDQATEFDMMHQKTRTLLNRISLDLPAQIFETEGMWLQIAPHILRECETRSFDLMGALHAIEHAAIGILPLLVMADPNDVGGMSTQYHSQIGSAVIFIFDGIPGGAGLTRQAFSRTHHLLQYTLKVVRDCVCETGCPSCVQSPRCGSGNRPMDKSGAIFMLKRLAADPAWAKIDAENDVGQLIENPAQPGSNKAQRVHSQVPEGSRKRLLDAPHFGVFDLETQRSAAEVGGWHRADRMGVSCGVIYDSQKDVFTEYTENQISQLIGDLQKFELIIGYNIKRFDFQVLKGYSDFDFTELNTLDILEDIHRFLGFRLSLASVAQETLGVTKTADGLQALQWWQQGRIREIIDYCRMDVKLTRDLFLFGRQNGYLIFSNRDHKRVRIPVAW